MYLHCTIQIIFVDNHNNNIDTEKSHRLVSLVLTKKVEI